MKRGGVDAKETEKLRADLAHMGMSEAQIDYELRDTIPADLAITPENWEAVMFFLSLHTQWRREWIASALVERWLGLNYCAVESALRIHRFKNRASLFAKIQIMETAALPILNGAAHG